MPLFHVIVESSELYFCTILQTPMFKVKFAQFGWYMMRLQFASKNIDCKLEMTLLLHRGNFADIVYLKEQSFFFFFCIK